MSLVNDMLRDLERREPASDSVIDGLRPVQNRRSQAGLVIGLIAGVAAIGVAAAFILRPTLDTPVVVAAAPPQPVAGEGAAGDREPAETARVVPAKIEAEVPNLPVMAFVPDVAPSVAPLIETAPVSDPTPPPAADRAPISVKSRRPSTIESQAREAYGEALRLRGQGRPEQAAGELELALSLMPNLHGARESLASTLVELGQFDAAAMVLDEGLELDPSHVPFAMLRARLIVEGGSVESAIAVLEATPPESFDAGYSAFLAALFQRSGEHDRAIEMYGHVLRAEPDNATWWMGLGISLEAVRRDEDALPVYRTARQVGGLSGEPRAFVDHRIRALGVARP